MNKNDAKRVPKSAVFTISANKVEDGANILGFIEGNMVITRVMAIVLEAFNGTAPSITVTDVEGGTTETHFTSQSLATQVVETSALFIPDAGGTRDPLLRLGKGQWNGNLVLGGSTVGEVMIVVEYTQLDTEPGLHSATNK